jgi:uncharacterized protein (TIGR04255 family)
MYGEVSIGPNAESSARHMQVGHMFVSEDEKQIFQARMDGFTFSRLAPYDRWEPFQAEAQRLWEIYRRHVEPTAIIRAAVRYINRLDLPFPFVELKDYLRTTPEVSPDFPRGALSGYVMQLHIPQDDIGAMLILSQALVPPPEGTEITSVLLDIDLFKEISTAVDEDTLWEVFETLHARKNVLFEACITDLTREVIR